MSRPISARMRPAPASASAEHRPSHNGELNEEDPDDFGVMDDDQDEEDDDEIDLDAYEAYLDDIKKKAAARPQSAHLMRPYPTESPQFYMVNTSNPVNPVDLSSITSQPTASRSATRPGVRPMSARPRLNPGEESIRPTAPHPRAPQTARPSLVSTGVRRRRQGSGTGGNTGNDGLNARIRAVYNDVGRTQPSSGSTSKFNTTTVTTTSHTATSVMQSRLKVFQDAELQHEYDRLVDVVSDLRSVVQHEQAQRLKAMARVRRLEEIVTMKDKKIESLLHAHGSASLTTHGSDSMSFAALAQREMAQKERLHHAVMQKLRHKLAQQSQILASYEEAMQALRATTKSTSLMEMEEEKQQLCIEVARLHDIISALQAELEHQGRQLVEFNGGDAQYQAQLGKMQQELKRSAHEKHKLEQETLFLKATVHQLEHKLALEQKKRVYDQSMASGERMLAGNRSPSSSAKSSPRVLSPTSSVRSPMSTAYLAEALAEMKMLKAEPASAVASSPVKTRRPTPLLTKSQLELCEAEEEEDRRREDREEDATRSVKEKLPDEGRRCDPPTTDLGERTSCPEESTSALVGLLKSPSEVAKKHVRWQISEEEEEEEEEGEGEGEGEGAQEDVVEERVETHHNEGKTEEVESVDEATDERRIEDSEDENDKELLEPERVEVEQVTTTHGGSEETHESRIESERSLDSQEKQEEDEEAQEDDHATVISLIGEHEVMQPISSGVEAEDEESPQRQNAPLEDEDPSTSSEASLSRTNSSELSHSSLTSHSSHSSHTSNSSSSSLSRSASGDSTSSSASSSSLSSLLAQEDAAAMALEEAAALKAAAEESAEESTPQDTEQEELQYASDFSDDAE